MSGKPDIFLIVGPNQRKMIEIKNLIEFFRQLKNGENDELNRACDVAIYVLEKIEKKDVNSVMTADEYFGEKN